jgi:hypothetical protein
MDDIEMQMLLPFPLSAYHIEEARHFNEVADGVLAELRKGRLTEAQERGESSLGVHEYRWEPKLKDFLWSIGCCPKLHARHKQVFEKASLSVDPAEYAHVEKNDTKEFALSRSLMKSVSNRLFEGYGIEPVPVIWEEDGKTGGFFSSHCSGSVILDQETLRPEKIVIREGEKKNARPLKDKFEALFHEHAHVFLDGVLNDPRHGEEFSEARCLLQLEWSLLKIRQLDWKVSRKDRRVLNWFLTEFSEADVRTAETYLKPFWNKLAEYTGAIKTLIPKAIPL